MVYRRQEQAIAFRFCEGRCQIVGDIAGRPPMIKDLVTERDHRDASRGTTSTLFDGVLICRPAQIRRHHVSADAKH